jgi:hypothetical protein
MEQHLIFCPHCGERYWITPMTLKIHCYQCGELVFHRGLAGFIDWEAMIVAGNSNPQDTSKVVRKFESYKV